MMTGRMKAGHDQRVRWGSDWFWTIHPHLESVFEETAENEDGGWMMVRCPSPYQERLAIRDENDDCLSAHRVKG